MIRFFEYCAFRIANTPFYKVASPIEYSYAQAIISLCQSFNLQSIIFFLLAGLHIHISIPVFYVVAFAVVIYIANQVYFLTDKKYRQGKKRWANEKNKKVKGWGVALYVIASFALYFIS